MKKVVILGCENSHANAFIELIRDKEEFADLQVVGVYSIDPEASKKLQEKYGVPVMESYDEAVGQVDGVIITARHGGYHYTFAKPYMESGVPMFVDKPIAIEEAELAEFLGKLKEKNIPLTGGSSLRHAAFIQELEKHCQEETGGKTTGGFVVAPLSTNNPHGGFYFYSQHMVEMACKAFGYYPKSVRVAMDENENRTVIFNYGAFLVTGLFVENGGVNYYAARVAVKETQGAVIPGSEMKQWYYGEFKEFADTLDGKPQPMSYEDFAAPVCILNAIDKASASGKEEPVSYLTF